jgi:hypothetical protein
MVALGRLGASKSTGAKGCASQKAPNERLAGGKTNQTLAPFLNTSASNETAELVNCSIQLGGDRLAALKQQRRHGCP